MTDGASIDAEGRLEPLVVELEQTAVRLRAGQLDADAAAELVERCAELAARVAAELEERARRAEAGPAPGAAGQESLL